MSIITLPQDRSLTFGDNYGNINHQGILSSNVSKTTPLPSTFPTTSTGDSLGHYHYTATDGSNALQFLNASSSGLGGHQFWVSNATTAPKCTGTIDENGYTMLVDNDNGNYYANGISIANSATFNNITLNNGDIYNPALTLTNTLFQQGIYASGGMTLINNSNNTQATFESTQQTITDFTNSSIQNSTQIRIETSGETNAIFINNSDSPIIRTTDSTNNQSVLSATDLTFNTVSLKTQVETNTTDISNINTNLSSLDNLIILQKTTTLQNISAAIYADAKPPIVPTPTIQQQYAFTPSWYFKNTFPSNNKINWYMGADIGMTVSQVLGIYLNIFNPSMTSNDLCPFLTIYTTNDTPSPPNFYKSKRTYLFNQSITPVINTRYFMFQNVSGTCPTPFHYGSVLNNMQLSTVAGSNVGNFSPTEVILAFAIGTNSASAINTVEFALSKFGIMTPYGTQEILFIPST
jgi:hypothetical protein